MGKSGVSGHPAARQAGDQDLRSVPPGRSLNEASAGAAGSGLTRVTVNLNRQALQALEQIGEATGYSKTDVINRAIQLYDLIQKIMQRNNGALNIKHDDGEIERILIL